MIVALDRAWCVAVRDQPGDQVLQVGPANVLDRLVTQVRQRRVGAVHPEPHRRFVGSDGRWLVDGAASSSAS
jgi:hypothetical protein